VYFYSESEWAGDWTPIIAVEDQNNKIVYTKFDINSISKTTDTPVYFVSPNDLYIGQYQVDINMMEDNEAKFSDIKIDSEYFIGTLKRRNNGECCWIFTEEKSLP
jgi:hypothetical protein